MSEHVCCFASGAELYKLPIHTLTSEEWQFCSYLMV